MDGDEEKLDNEVTTGQGREEMEKTIARMEQEFGQKRAQFMELFKQKEEALGKTNGELNQVKQEKEEIYAELANLKAEIEGIKTAAAISENSKQDELAGVQRQCQEEMASMQHIMKENIASARLAATEKLEQERARWLKNQERLENEVTELKSKLSQEREGFLANMAKQLQKKVATTVGGSNTEAENLEEDMKKAKEDAEILRSVVMPLEEEISSLKSKLRDAMGRVRGVKPQDSTEHAITGDIEEELGTTSDDPPLPKMTTTTAAAAAAATTATTADADERVKELHQHLETEKSSRTDLEMYVAVLNTQKTVLQDESDKLRHEIQEVCSILAEERRENGDLKRTWQMANDQFLEAQRLMMMDMRRMEGVLTAEQQRQITELKKKDADREAQERRIRELEQKREEEEEKKKKRKKSDSSAGGGSFGGGSQTSLVSTDALIKLDDELSMQRSQSFTLSPGSQDHPPRDPDSRSLGAASPERHIPATLTDLQTKALTDPTPENTASEKLLASAKMRSVAEPISSVGKRLVSENEWQMLQQEMKAAREKLGRPCDMCHNYEAQLQQIQDTEKRASSQVRTLERQLEVERQAMKNHEKYTADLEEKLRTSTIEAEVEISTLTSKVEEFERFTHGMRSQFDQVQTELSDQLKLLTENREHIHKELVRLQEDNDSLVGKHSKHSQQLQEECINLPDTMEEMQLLLLKFREEVIQAKVAKEHAEDTKHSEIMFLKDQVKAEQQERTTMEEALSQEITGLQEQLAVLQSVKSELDRQSKVRAEAEAKVKEMENQLKSIQAKSKQLIGALQGQLEETANARSTLEQQVLQLRNKVTSLQVDLDNSEAVQRDFVKLSQSLQIQLEKIRAAEQEVRWQHEEDAEDCNNCKQPFSVTRRKNWKQQNLYIVETAQCEGMGEVEAARYEQTLPTPSPSIRPVKTAGTQRVKSAK